MWKERGFSLIEMVFALGALSTVTLLLMTSSFQVSNSEERNIQRWQAQLTGESVADMVGSLDPASFTQLLFTSLNAGCSAACKDYSGNSCNSLLTAVANTTPAANAQWLSNWVALSRTDQIKLTLRVLDATGNCIALVAANQASFDPTQYDIEISTAVSFHRLPGTPSETVTFTKTIGNY